MRVGSERNTADIVSQKRTPAVQDAQLAEALALLRVVARNDAHLRRGNCYAIEQHVALNSSGTSAVCQNEKLDKDTARQVEEAQHRRWCAAEVVLRSQVCQAAHNGVMRGHNGWCEDTTQPGHRTSWMSVNHWQ